LSLIAAGGFANINPETTVPSYLTRMLRRLKICAVASGDMVMMDIGTAEDVDEITNMVRLKVG
jgi:hypothetical protein